jgi:hypothetical protein
MGTRDPTWLNGERESPSQAFMWHDQSHRQFCVLPAYERGDSTKPAMYAMWGRALSDGCFYPIAPSVYTLELKPLEERNGGTQRYQWRARTHGHSALSIPVEMQEVVAHWTGDEARLSVAGPVTPEFVEAGWPHRTPTVFYPDGSLWTPDRLDEGEFDEFPMPISRDTDPMQRAPVVAKFDPIFQQVYISGVSTQHWRR